MTRKRAGEVRQQISTSRLPFRRTLPGELIELLSSDDSLQSTQKGYQVFPFLRGESDIESSVVELNYIVE